MVAPVSLTLGEHHGETVRGWMRSIGGWNAEPGVSPEEVLNQGSAVLNVLVLAVAGLVVLVLNRVRRRSSARFVAAYRAGEHPKSASLRITVGMWVVVMVAAAIVGVFADVADPAERSALHQRFLDNPRWMLLAPAGALLGAMLSNWFHRRSYEYDPLIESGHARYAAASDRTGPPSLTQGFRAFGWAVIIESTFTLAWFAYSVFTDDRQSLESVASSWVAAIFLVPGTLALVLVAMMWATRPFRWIVRDIVKQPLVRWSFFLVVGGFLLNAVAEAIGFFTDQEQSPAALAAGEAAGEPVVVTALVVLAAVALIIGIGIATVTGLYTQDLGPQPWAGFIFLGFIYLFSLTGAEGDLEVPSGLFRWIVALAAGAFVVHEGAKLWRTSYGETLLVPSTPGPVADGAAPHREIGPVS